MKKAVLREKLFIAENDRLRRKVEELHLANYALNEEIARLRDKEELEFRRRYENQYPDDDATK